jgi:hypothetical protein
VKVSALVLVGLGSCACVGLSHTSSGPSSLLDASQPRAEEPIVHISSSGTTPTQLHLNAPATVTFTNLDSVPHRLQDAPQLGFGSCPEINRVGTIPPGQGASIELVTVEFICAYADAAQPTNAAFQGVIVLH